MTDEKRTLVPGERRSLKRSLLIVVLGVGFLIVMTFGASILDTLVPHQPTAPVQRMQVGSYQLSMQVNPNPPLTGQVADIVVQIQNRDTQQLIKDAWVRLTNSMTGMPEMGSEQVTAKIEADGNYHAQLHFISSGAWQVRVAFLEGSAKEADATFGVTAQ